MACSPAASNITPPYFNEFRFDKIAWAGEAYTKVEKRRAQFPTDKIKQIQSSTSSEMEFAIENSKKILNLEFGWDDDGALPVDKSNYVRAIKFLRDYDAKISLDGKHKTNLKVPDINPVKDGSVDIEWNLPNSYFLINFKTSNHNAAYFYGKFDGELDINGKIETKEISDKIANHLADLS